MFWIDPLFWICIALVGFILAIIIFSAPALKNKFLNFPKPFGRVIILFLFQAPLIALPLTPQPRLTVPNSISSIIGISLIFVSSAIRILAQKKIGISPGLQERRGLVTTSIYRIIRHPLYIGNLLFAGGWALIFKAVFALLFTPVQVIGYLAIIFFEEKELEKEYGEEYREYKKKTPWRLIPNIF